MAKIQPILSNHWQAASQFLKAAARQVVVSLLLVVLIASTVLGNSQNANATNFDRKNLRQQDFSGQDLTDNDYTRADLTEANLSHTNLELVRLFTTRLTRANLEGAYAINIDFRGANIEGADFTDVLLDPKDNDRLCEIASGTNSETGRETRETLFCP